MTVGIFYKEWNQSVYGTWADWSGYLLNEPNLKRRIESENSGEAGLIVFDDIELEMRLEKINGSASPVATALDESTLNAKSRLLIQVRAYKGTGGVEGTDFKVLFEGMINLASISYPYNRDESSEIIKTVRFTVIDKLMAMASLEPVNFGREITDLADIANRSSSSTTSLTGNVSGAQGTNVIIGVGTAFTTELRAFNNGNGEAITDLADLNILPDSIKITDLGSTGIDLTASVKKIHSDTKLEIWGTLEKNFSNTFASRIRTTKKESVLHRPYVNGEDYISDNEGKIAFYGYNTIYDPDEGIYNVQIDITQNISLNADVLEVGDIISYYQDRGERNQRDVDDPSASTLDRDLYLVVGVIRTDSNQKLQVKVLNSTNPFKITNDSFYNYHFECAEMKVLDKDYFGNDFLITASDGTYGTVATAYDGLALLESLVNSIWPDVAIESDDYSDYELPLNYFTRLVDYRPFNSHPLDAIKWLAASMNAYVWFEPGSSTAYGKLKVKRWDNLNSETATANLNNYMKHFKSGEKKYFWDKLVDGVEVYVKSWVPEYNDEGEWVNRYIDGAGSAYKSSLGQPRNKLSKSIIVDETTLASYGITINDLDDYLVNANKINNYADLKAAEYLDFYGKRHYSFPMSFILHWDMLSWDLVDVFTMDSDKYFIDALDIDLSGDTVSFELVSAVGYAFDVDKVVIDKIEDGYVSSQSSSGSTDRTVGSSVLYINEGSTGSYGEGSTDITTLGIITTGTWEADPIVADFIEYNPHNLDNDYYSGEIDFVSEDSETNAVLQTTSAHSIRLGATVTISDLNFIADGDYTVVNIPDATSFTINASPSNTGSDSGYVIQTAHLNTIQDIGLLDMPQFFGLKLDYEETSDYANYVPRDYVFEVTRKDTSEIATDYGYFRLFPTNGGGFGEGGGSLAFSFNQFEDEFYSIYGGVNPEEGFFINQGYTQMQKGTQSFFIKSADSPDLTYTTKYATNQWLDDSYHQYYYIDLLTLPTLKYSESRNYASGFIGYNIYNEGVDGHELSFQHNRGSQATTPDFLNLNDEIAKFSFSGYNEDYSRNAMIKVLADGTHGATSMPTRFEFWTTADQEYTAQSRLVINNEGKLGFGVLYDEIVGGRDLTFANSYGMGNPDFVSGWMVGTGWWLEAEEFTGNLAYPTDGASAGNGKYLLYTTQNHGYSAGDRVVISGMAGAEAVLNGGYIVQSTPTSDSFIILNEYTGTMNYPEGVVTPVAYEYNMTVDNLDVRGTLSVWEFLVHQIQVTNGNLIVSSAAKTTSALLNDGSNYFEVEDVTEHGYAPFLPNDIIMCQQVNWGSLEKELRDGTNAYEDNWTLYATHGALVKRYIYRVTSVSGLKVYVATDGMGTLPTSKGIVEPGDSVVRIGNTTNSSRQGFIGFFSDDKYAPYMRIADEIDTWTAFKQQTNTKVQIGNLEGLADTDFGGVMDTAIVGKKYGMYLTDNIFMKGNLVVKASAANQMSLVTESIMVGNVDHTASPVASAIAITRDDDGTPDLINSGIFGYDASANQIFALRLDDSTVPHHISNWYFDQYTLYKGNVRLEASQLTGEGEDIDGLVISDGSVDVVKVGDFTYEAVTPTMSNVTTTVLWESIPSSYGVGATKWHGEGYYYWYSGGDQQATAFTNSAYENTSEQTYYYRTLPASATDLTGYDFALTCPFRDNDYILGRDIKVEFKIVLRDRQEQGQDNGCEFYADIAFPLTNGTRARTNLHQQTIANAENNVTIDKTGGNAIEISVPVGVEWTSWTGDINLEFRIYNPPSQGQTSNSKTPRFIDATAIKVYGYERVYTFINDEGFEVYNSPSRYMSFRNGIFTLVSPELSLGGKSAARYYGKVSSVPTTDEALPGDIYQGADNAFYVVSGSVSADPTKPEVFKISGTTPDNEGGAGFDPIVDDPPSDYDLIVYDPDGESEGVPAWINSKSIASLTFKGLNAETYDTTIHNNDSADKSTFRITTQSTNGGVDTLTLGGSNHSPTNYYLIETTADKFYFNVDTWTYGSIGIYDAVDYDTSTYLGRGVLSLDHTTGSTITLTNNDNGDLDIVATDVNLSGNITLLADAYVNLQQSSLKYNSGTDVLEIDSGTGDTQILQSGYLSAQFSNDAKLYYAGTEFLTTSATGGSLLGSWSVQTGLSVGGYNVVTVNDLGNYLTADGNDTKTAGELKFNDDIYLKIGTGSDAVYWATGTSAYIDVDANSTLDIRHDGYSQIHLGYGVFKFPSLTTNGFVKTSSGDGTLIIDASTYLKADGSVPLSANWDVGSFTITASRFISDQGSGVAPFTVASTTTVTNLSADTVDGVHADSFLRSDVADAKTSGTLTMNDSVYLAWGTSNDTYMTYDGANDILILEVGDNDYEVRSDGYEIFKVAYGYYGFPQLTTNGFLKTSGGDGQLIVDSNTYAQTDGTGASGTWGISISGNANSATTAVTASNASTLDNLDSTQFLRSDTADIKTAGELRFNNNITLLFGTTGAESEMYSNGTNTYFNQLNTGGSIFLQNNGYDLLEIDDGVVRLPHLTSNGFLKTSGSNGTVSVDTTSYLTGNQTITLTGDVSGSGTTSITVTVANDSHSHSNYLSSDADDVKTAGYTRYNDNNYLRIGTGSDAIIWATGTNAYIDADANSVLQIRHDGYAQIELGYGTFKFPQLTSNGFLKTSGSDGTLSVDTATYATQSWVTSQGYVTSAMTNFVLEDGDGTEVTITDAKEIKFVEGNGIDINWTDVTTGSDADPYDLTFALKDLTSALNVNDSVILGFGNSGAESEIYSNGTNTYINQKNTSGSLFLTNDGQAGFEIDYGSVKLNGISANGFVKTSSSNGTLTVDTTTYLTTAVTSAVGGTGIDVSASTGAVTFSVDLSELSDMTAAMVGTDEFIVLDASADRRKAANEIGLSVFNNDSGFITGNQTITLSGDASGSGTTSISVTVANDSHTHDTRYYTETEIDAFGFLGASGGAITSNYLRMNDLVELYFGSSNDTYMHYNGTTNELILELGDRNFTMRSDGYDIYRMEYGYYGFPQLTSNGFLKTTGSDGQLVVDTNSYSLSSHDHDGDYQSHAVLAQGNSSTPPNVSGKVMYRITSYAGSGALETINGGSTGQILVVVVDTSYTFSVVETGNIRTIGSGLSLGQYDSVVFIYTGTIWHQITPVANY